MSVYRDGPNQLMYEAQQIAVSAVKTAPDTYTIAWNVPNPVFGCDPSARAYNGVVVVASTVPISQVDKPVRGNIYTADPTVSPDLHAGDVIGNALVVGSFYDDDITTQVTVTGVDSATPYYFGVFAVSAQLTYDPNGAYAYSLPLGREGEFKDYPAYHELRVLGPNNRRMNVKTFTEASQGSMLGSAATNLDPSTSYEVTLCSDRLGDNVSINIMGNSAQTWDEFVESVNREIALISNPIMSPSHPNIGSYYYDATSQRLFVWNGVSYDEQSVINSSVDPAAPTEGQYRYDGTVLHIYTAGNWNAVPFTQYHKLYDEVAVGDIWINSQQSFAAVWDGATWCQRELFTTSTNPEAPVVEVGQLWFNSSNSQLQQWTGSCWSIARVMNTPNDPTTPMDGQLWHNPETNELWSYSTSDQGWIGVPVKVSEVAAKRPADGDVWINSKTAAIKRYNFTTKKWDPLTAIVWDADPRDRQSCDKWWNVTTNVVYSWDFLTQAWVVNTHFLHTDVDPSTIQPIRKGAVWTTAGIVRVYDGMQWLIGTAIDLPHDPRVPVLGDITHVDGSWWKHDGITWNPLNVTNAIAGIADGAFWFHNNLNQRIAGNWVTIPYVSQPQIPMIGSQYYNTTTKKLMEWRGGTYVPAQLPARLLINELNNVVFVSSTLGSTSKAVMILGQALKDRIRPLVVSFEPSLGIDHISTTPTYKTQGIGTDGSVDERRELANYVLSQLGYPKVQVELTKRQVDEAIDDALEMLRMRTSAVYTRAYMALDILPDQQVYELSNKKGGADRVVRVMKIHRTRYGRIGAYSYEDTFGSAMIQQLYYAGSFDILSYHLLASYNELINQVFANDVTFSWSEYNRTLHIHQVVRNKERVLAEVELEKTEQELMQDRNLRAWIKKYTLAKCMLTLARIRGKFGSLPGAGGGISLNGNDLSAEGTTMIEECIADIDNMVISGIDQYGSSSMVIMG